MPAKGPTNPAVEGFLGTTIEHGGGGKRLGNQRTLE